MYVEIPASSSAIRDNLQHFDHVLMQQLKRPSFVTMADEIEKHAHDLCSGLKNAMKTTSYRVRLQNSRLAT